MDLKNHISEDWKTVHKIYPKIRQMLEAIWPVGSIYLSISETNPANTIGFGTWVNVAKGQFIVGHNDYWLESDFDVPEKTGGSKTHTLTVDEIPAHNHGVTDPGHVHGQHVKASDSQGTAGVQGASEASDTTNGNTASANTGITIDNAGAGNAHSIIPPYYVVVVWKRTA